MLTIDSHVNLYDKQWPTTHFQMIDRINQLRIHIVTRSCICRLRVDNIYQMFIACPQKTKEESASILDFGRFFFGEDSPAVGSTATGVELLFEESRCECHDVKSCRCIVALKAAASLLSFDIVSWSMNKRLSNTVT